MSWVTSRAGEGVPRKVTDPESITHYTRPARLWRIGTELSPRSIVHHDGEGVDAVAHVRERIEPLIDGHAGDGLVSSELPARGLRGVLRLSVGRFR